MENLEILPLWKWTHLCGDMILILIIIIIADEMKCYRMWKFEDDDDVVDAGKLLLFLFIHGDARDILKNTYEWWRLERKMADASSFFL